MQTRLLKLFLYITLFVAAGCSSETITGNNAPSSSTGNIAVFNLTTGEIPLPNILATATAKDPLAGRAVGSPMTPPEALAYVNKYEMAGKNAVAGVNAPIYIRFSAPVDPATVTAANIKVFQLTPDAAGTENSALGFADISGMFDYKYTAGGTDLFLFQKFPLSPASRYAYVVSNRVRDAATGEAIKSSAQFEVLKSTVPLVGAFEKLEAIRANVVSGGNILLSGYAKVMDDLITAGKVASRSEIALMGRFITTGAGFVSKDGSGSTASMMPVESALRAFAAGSALGGLPGVTWTNGVNNPQTIPAASYWTAVGAPGSVPSTLASVVTGTINSADLSIDPVIARASANAGSIDLTAVGGYNPASGVVQPFRSGANLTGFYYVHKKVPFVYLVPTTPNGKVVVFQHGITGRKEQVVAVASALTGAGYAVVAIDLPLHGDIAVPGHTVGAQWGQDFMAIGAPLATRSNIQQGAFNLNRLELTLKTGGFAASVGTVAPPSEIKFVGVSLGSIVGAYYLAGNTTLNSTASLPYPYNQTTLDADMKGFLSVPGGKTAYLIQNSPSFGPTVDVGLAAVGIPKNSPTYHNFFQVTQSIVDPVDPATMTSPLVAGLPSRLSGRVAIQEAIGDTVIPNEYTRYLGSALGSRGSLPAPFYDIAPGFMQLGYNGRTTPGLPAQFMAKTALAATSPGAATPKEGYFQFDQTGVSHGFLLGASGTALATMGQTQMGVFLGYNIVMEPPASAAKALAQVMPLMEREILLPKDFRVLGY